VPRLRQSGKRAFSGARGLPLGNARLRHRLWMLTLVAVRKNPWLRAHYDRLVAAGKRPKVAIVACMRKLLGAIYSVARNRRPFVPYLARPLHEQPMTAGRRRQCFQLSSFAPQPDRVELGTRTRAKGAVRSPVPRGQSVHAP
jgi:hypothetical protein